jgi:hypothetical protein
VHHFKIKDLGAYLTTKLPWTSGIVFITWMISKFLAGFKPIPAEVKLSEAEVI